VFCKLFDHTCTTTLWDFQTCNFFSNIVFTFARITFIKVLWWNENLFTFCLGIYFFSNSMFINISWHTQCFFHNIAYLQAQLDFCTFTHKHFWVLYKFSSSILNASTLRNIICITFHDCKQSKNLYMFFKTMIHWERTHVCKPKITWMLYAYAYKVH